MTAPTSPPVTGLGHRFAQRLTTAEIRSAVMTTGGYRLMFWALLLLVAGVALGIVAHGPTLTSVLLLVLVPGVIGFTYWQQVPGRAAKESLPVEILVDEDGVQLWREGIHTVFAWDAFDEAKRLSRVLLLRKKQPNLLLPLSRRCFTEAELGSIQGWVNR